MSHETYPQFTTDLQRRVMFSLHRYNGSNMNHLRTVTGANATELGGALNWLEQTGLVGETEPGEYVRNVRKSTVHGIAFDPKVFPFEVQAKTENGWETQPNAWRSGRFDLTPNEREEIVSAIEDAGVVQSPRFVNGSGDHGFSYEASARRDVSDVRVVARTNGLLRPVAQAHKTPQGWQTVEF